MISQQLGAVGYQVVTVDGPRVTVEYYATEPLTLRTPAEQEGHVPHMSDLTFTKRETFGYSLNGKHFAVAEGKPYTTVADSVAAGDCCGEKGYLGTKMQILAGVNGNTATCTYDKRPFTKDVNTGWAPGSGTGLASDVLVAVGHHRRQLQPPRPLRSVDELPPGEIGAGQDAQLAGWNGTNWVNAVDLDSDLGASRHFVSGPFDVASDFQLGCYGFDPATHTAWAVIDHGATEFGVQAAQAQAK